MAESTKCQTPDAIYKIQVNDRHLACLVEFPKAFKMTKAEAELLEANAHNALELVLAPIWNNWF